MAVAEWVDPDALRAPLDDPEEDSPGDDLWAVC
jgi:hypothetical protein